MLDDLLLERGQDWDEPDLPVLLDTYAVWLTQSSVHGLSRQGSQSQPGSFRAASSPPAGGAGARGVTPTEILELKRDLFAAWREVAANQAARRARSSTSEGVGS